MSDNSLAIADPFALDVLDEETEVRALSCALQLAEGFSLLFVCCNQPQQRERLVADLRKRLPQLTVKEIHFGEPIIHLLDALSERLEGSALDAVFVSGLEYSLPTAADAHATPLVANLNAARNSFPQVVPCPLVLWVPEYVLTAIARGAPDFFSIRSGVYYFAATPQETASFAASLAAGEGWQVANMPLQEKLERIAAIQSLLDEYRDLPPAQRDRRAEARLLSRLGNFYRTLGRWAAAETTFKQSLVVCREVGDRVAEGNALNDLGGVYHDQRWWAEAETCCQQSLAIRREVGDRVGEGQTLNSLGDLYQHQGRWTEAENVHKQSLAICRELGDRVGEGQTLNNLGIVYQAQGWWAEAEECHQQSLAIRRELGDRVGEGKTLNNLGIVYGAQGRWAEAEAAYQQSLAIFREFGDQVGEEKPLHNLALLREAQGDIAGALEFARQAVRVLEKTEARAELEEARALVAKWEGQEEQR